MTAAALSGTAGASPAVTGTGVVVVGMHRSGTSATTRVLNLLGLPTAERSDLWLELPGNPTGYWESSSLTRFNERLLNRFGATWWAPPDVGTAARLADADAPRAEGEHLFHRLHPSTSWVWKDPRVCVTLPFWRAVLRVPLVGVLSVRHPLEIAASLWERDGIGTGWALTLWERYTRHALMVSPDAESGSTGAAGANQLRLSVPALSEPVRLLGALGARSSSVTTRPWSRSRRPGPRRPAGSWARKEKTGESRSSSGRTCATPHTPTGTSWSTRP